MRRELLELASELARRGEPFAIATVVARKSPMSAQPGDTALVTREGGFHGWVGGACTRPTVIAQALAALADSRPRLVALDPDPQAYQRPGLTVFPMTCHSGGTVEIHIQPVLPSPHLVVYGASPIARALVALGRAMGYRLHAVDPGADADTFPGADSVLTEASALKLESPGVPVFAVVATQGTWDEGAIAAALAQRPRYLAVVASPRRFGEMRAMLAAEVPAEDLARIKNPAGLSIGARLPEEIALSILAEIVQEQRREGARGQGEPSTATTATETATTAPPDEPTPVRPRPASARGEGGVRGTPTHAAAALNPPPARRSSSLSLHASAPSATAAEGLDPVCGMTVHERARAPRAEHGGRTFYFCCAGCQQRFVAAPERYLGAS
jgi:xanthine dehydrogenase accessory factor